MAAGIFGSVEHTKVTWAWAFHHVWEWPHKECWGWTLTLVWNQNTRSATTNYTCRSIISHEVSMLLNSSSVQKQNYRLRVLRKTLTPSIGDAHLRLRTFLLVNKSNHAFSEVKRIQQLEENGGCALKNKKKKTTSDLPGEATITTTATTYRTTHTSHLDKLGHEVGPQCGGVIEGRRLTCDFLSFQTCRGVDLHW